GLAADSCGGSAGLSPDFPVASHGYHNTRPAPAQRGRLAYRYPSTLSISCGAADITFSWIEEPCRSMLLARAALACRASKLACVANCAAKSFSTGLAAGVTAPTPRSTRS